MALYHFSAQIISRANGQSACAAAAYRSGEKIVNDYDGITHDYQQKFNVKHSIVMLPEGAPACFRERSVLWNSVEQNEKQINAQLAREINFSLPRELSPDVQMQVALVFIQEQFVDRGMIADVCFHNPPKMNSKNHPVDAHGIPTDDPKQFVYENPHVHVMLPLRPLDTEGKWESKTQKLYVCEKDDVQKLFSASQLKNDGTWSKIFHYESKDGVDSWHTKSYASQHPDECAKLINRYPKSVQVVNEKVAKWNSQEMLMTWRAAWADAVNSAYEFSGLDTRIDHRSYSEQGLDLIPTIHEGKFITIEEKRIKEEYDFKIRQGENAVLQHTEVRNLNNAIRVHNTEIKMIIDMKKLQTKMERLLKPVLTRIEQFSFSLAESLERLRVNLILLNMKHKGCVALKGEADEKILANQKYIDNLTPAREERMEELRFQIIEIKKQISKTVLRVKKEILVQKLEQLQAQVRILEENKFYANKAQEEIRGLKESSMNMGAEILQLQESKELLLEEYFTTEQSVTMQERNDVNSKRIKIRQSIEMDSKVDIDKNSYKKEAEEVDTFLGCSLNNLTELRPLDVAHHNVSIKW